MKKQFKGFIIGFIFACLLVVPTMALADDIQAQFNTVNITVDGKNAVTQGESYQLSDGSVVPFSINYKGTTYLPVRKVSELLSLSIEYDNASKTVQIVTSTKATDDSSKTNQPTTTSPAISDKTTTDESKDNSTKTTTTNNSSTQDLKVASTGYSVINECSNMTNAAGKKVQQIIGFNDGKKMDTATSDENIVKSWSAPKLNSTGFSGSAVYELDFASNGVIVGAEKISANVEAAKAEKANSRTSVTMGGKTYAISENATFYRVTDDEYKLFTGNLKENDMIQLYDTDSSKDGYEIVIFSRL
ncbi:stalk domain-containing protein [Clostridium aminobutyricum]|uniref:Copper amine oxidase-like N-terminal domain-containing protein n=1 Tax=Clostridium aminobutyricum TaxID=33953 RepID=A0A939IJP9_CLOAM|nr:stalk domain-containing protein [Clostridium aminobutyricum]MBN7774326.1 hypothetical protein [Clostridium aminobutyricum]